MSRAPLFLPCAAGVEALLADEVARLLPEAQVRAVRGGVGLEGGVREVMLLNLESRLAQRVLIEVAEGAYAHEDDLYALARGVDWTLWITPRQTLRVDTTAQRSPLRSLNFAALRIKDGVCDMLRDATGERPSVDTRHPDLQLVLHLGAGARDAVRRQFGRAAVQARLAGRQGRRAAEGNTRRGDAGRRRLARHARGRRRAARPLLRLGNDCDRGGADRLRHRAGPAAPLRVRAPGAVRAGRGAPQWRELKAAAQARIHASAVPIFASDVSFRMVDFARRNAERAGVAQAITFNGGDALERPAPALPPGLPGTLMLNPPYGERIEVLGKAGARCGATLGRGPQHPRRLLPPPGGALEAGLHAATPQAGRPGCSAPT